MESLISTVLYFIIAIVMVLIGITIFELITKKYKDLHEVLNGNRAVSLSIGGKIIGICIILSFSIYHASDILDTVIWGAFGILLQIIAYLIFELFIRKFSVEEELRKGNISVGVISFCISVGIAFVIGASIS
ncbi:DUF350 domain-containing protein [Fictibacillus terranigra]|uniref:DUF350 domain-containing protein n=1 Tax=Fictibacillus terranigra TaxID=3058424 RepID=A0ABT8E4T9_9BACL|nr:DUF350 domain-containing protein [Fictibacillus sp. CENA-BCM004]MDN4072894.1 DUF350 domain-containing protein [Fictibacillus sp. CENA-BCM004]